MCQLWPSIRLCACKSDLNMTMLKPTLKTHLEGRSLVKGDRVRTVGVQFALFLILMLGSGAPAQDSPGAGYTRTSQPAMLSYQELVALGEETVDPALNAKLHTLLTTPFVNNEAYFNGTKPLRPDLKGLGPSLRVVEWNIERGIEFDKIKLALTDKQGFIDEVHR